ncbi:hypothetical protein [Paenibacillus sp. BR1-192]|uniref:hypothetical protein n=1 Tax=Paenibacillus sp. BR1-192 TaxID=3032287 RepID=UPI00240D1D16|nr:hypothetical protein [Paenibacillus sp. BR1-192]WFB60571.1 hypothetical protein P0X86_10360 [Paenibacillus sp. BR1-192]
MLMEYWDNQKQERVTVSTDNPLPMSGGGGGGVPADGSITTNMIQDGAVTSEKLAANAVSASKISDASVVGRNVLTAADAAGARSAIGAGTSNQNLSALTSAEATTGTATTARAITAAVLAGAINERTKNKAAIAALSPITDPAAADAEAVATLLNQVIAALQA